VDSVPDSILLRKSSSAGNPTRNLWICNQKLWPLDDRGGYTEHVMNIINTLRQILLSWWFRKVRCAGHVARIKCLLKFGREIWRESSPWAGYEIDTGRSERCRERMVWFQVARGRDDEFRNLLTRWVSNRKAYDTYRSRHAVQLVQGDTWVTLWSRPELAR
jgi:hypothetical protein